MIRRRLLACALSGLAPLAVHTTAVAESAAAWPTKPVNIVVSFAPGGATDLVGRVLAKELQAVFKQPFVVINKPGAGGQVGTEYVANQHKGDAYTLLISATGHVMAPSSQSNVKYDPVKSFEPVALLITMPNYLLVRPDHPAKTLPEFMAWAKTQKSIGFGSAGNGGATHLSGELLRHKTGLPFAHVPYQGNGPSMNDVLAGHLPVAISDTVSSASMVSSGKLRPIAVTTAKRSPLFKDVPSLSEAGVKDYDLQNWVGLYFSANVPKPIVERLNKEVVRIMSTEPVRSQMEKMGAESANGYSAARYTQFVGDEVKNWANVFKVTGVQVNQ
ncbi:ABC transporter substrate-binding protein [Comamonas serinivorans]|uniref:ABC transporter substrate-binding protein n=1 Tax=Comamonas serinivorans TaxID=1082851 RepID=A0A1Y0EPL3_9BURK|nr:tripartite tricarboxylate transporter substrate binding protein [Comamonas serinivorans]ARU05239.1 ABC transporter substrate-binding protein [Comamonas serinivorans]